MAPIFIQSITIWVSSLSLVRSIFLLASVTHEQSKREFMMNGSSTQSVVVSSRWNPTPEQLRTLEDLYRRGTRTPSADQIQHITAQLRRYGKIEGKNVFYWFQNHKARERQKRRRQLESASDDHHHHRDIESFERKDSGASRTGYEVEQTKNWAPPTSCSTFAEESISVQMAAKAAAAAAGGAECRTDDGWIQFDDEELQHSRRSLIERNATWQMMHLSCSPPSTHHHLINTTTATATGAIIRSMDPKQLIRAQDLNLFISPACRGGAHHPHALNHLTSTSHVYNNDYEEAYYEQSHQTLQLFPLRSTDGNNENHGTNEKDITEASIAAAAKEAAEYQYFEFLPLKN